MAAGCHAQHLGEAEGEVPRLAPVPLAAGVEAQAQLLDQRVRQAVLPDVLQQRVHDGLAGHQQGYD